MTSLPPGVLLVLGSLLVPLLRGRARQVYLVALAVGSLAAQVALHRTGVVTPLGTVELMGYTLTPVRADALSLVFGYAFHLTFLLATIFALHVEDPLQHVAACWYGGATIAAAFAGDLISLFVWWEVVALASVFLVWARRTERAYRAGLRYLLWQVLSGLLLLAGILVHARAGDLGFGKLGLDLSAGLLASLRSEPGNWLIFLAFGIKASFPLLHTWLVDAYPEATATGTVYLSAFTTKLAIYALARAFPGTGLLIGIGTVMAAFPIFYAVIENDLRRVLAYSLINQLGYMVAGIGVGTELAINGAVAQVFAHILFKSLLFMSMGAVLHQTGRINGSDLGGLWKRMPFTAACCIVGAASISAFPLFSAFATKSLIMTAVADASLGAWLVLLFAAAGVFHHAGIKVPYFAFFAHDAGLRPKEAPLNMRVAMGLCAAVCIAIGCWPEPLYGLLPYPATGPEYSPYTAFHVVAQLQLLFFSALAFVTLMLTGLYPAELRSVNLDVDWILRRPVAAAWGAARARLGQLASGFQTLALESLPRASVAFVRNYGPERGPLRGQWVMGSTIVIVLLLLFFFVVIGLDLARPHGG